MRLKYLRDDGTIQPARISGLAADRPAAATVPDGSHYIPEDAPRWQVCDYSSGTPTWVEAVANLPVGDASPSASGLVLLHRNPSGGSPLAVSLDDLGAASGVAVADGAGHIAPARLPHASPTALGAVKQGLGTSIAGDGTVSLLPGGIGSIGVLHNGTLIATRPQLNFTDGGGILWDIQDDPGNTRGKISATAQSSLALFVVSLTSDFTQNGDGGSGAYTAITPLSLALPIGTYLAFVQLLFYTTSGGAVQPTARIRDGASSYGGITRYADITKPTGLWLVTEFNLNTARTVHVEVNFSGNPGVTYHLKALTPAQSMGKASKLVCMQIA